MKMPNVLRIDPRDGWKVNLRKILLWLVMAAAVGGGTVVVTTDDAEAAPGNVTLPHDHSSLARGGSLGVVSVAGLNLTDGEITATTSNDNLRLRYNDGGTTRTAFAAFPGSSVVQMYHADGFAGISLSDSSATIPVEIDQGVIGEQGFLGANLLDFSQSWQASAAFDLDKGFHFLMDSDNDDSGSSADFVLCDNEGRSGYSGCAVSNTRFRAQDNGVLTGKGFFVLSKTADEGFSSGTLANITGLSFSVQSNAKYMVDCFVSVAVSVTTAGVQIGNTGPAGTDRAFHYSIADPSGTNNIVRSGSSVSLANCGDGGLRCEARVSGTVHVGGTAGTWALQAARVGGAGTTTIREESMCEVRLVSF